MHTYMYIVLIRDCVINRNVVLLVKTRNPCSLIAVGKKKRQPENLWEVNVYSSLLHQFTKMVFGLAYNLSRLRRLSKIDEALNHWGTLQSVSLKEGLSVGIAHSLFHCVQTDSSSVLLLRVRYCCCRVVTPPRRRSTDLMCTCLLQIVTKWIGYVYSRCPPSMCVTEA